ncbi:TetR/AcrR family transcriptional regulator [Microlunatus flavus]|uniref:DNA-binding transcriptional regulator, AcrR family n=1 Tax=Microlunatus flavus TaxID=1036181 RepID=A0A1H9MF25_9ACTN|nr:TetR/AcrR family transcriptional regulator [Microlunatus flavus]SER22272.1 DNA-binding transcriptional regulator, AcrR family [Microlunatus flavus]
MPSTPPLVERKQRAARERIVRAAAELFAERGYAKVSVADIAERAEVGRTTFFRHFGDKQEVVFAREEALLQALTAEHLGRTAPENRSPRSAVQALQPLVLQLCAQITEDPEDYRRHERLVEGNIELRGRSAAKTQVIAERLSALLVEEGWDEGVARFAGQIALACYATGRASSDRAEALVADTRAAFEQVLGLGTEP